MGRPLSEPEAEVVRFVANALGVAAVAEQVKHATVNAARHQGGIWLDVEVSPAVSNHGAMTGHLPPEGQAVSVLDENGDVRGGVILWLDDGFLTAIEIYDWMDEDEVPLPRPQQLRLGPSSDSQ